MLVEGVGPKKAQDLVAAIVRADSRIEVLRGSSGRSGKGLKELANGAGEFVGDATI